MKYRIIIFRRPVGFHAALVPFENIDSMTGRFRWLNKDSYWVYPKNLESSSDKKYIYNSKRYLLQKLHLKGKLSKSNISYPSRYFDSSYLIETNENIIP